MDQLLSKDKIREMVLFAPDILQIIFFDLKLHDQNTFRLVCKDWHKLAHTFWEPIVYDYQEKIKNNKIPSEIMNEIKERPLLKHIKCIIPNPTFSKKFVACILEHVENLHSLQISYLTLEQGIQIAQKYPNLRSVCLDIKSENILSIIESWKSSKSLETLKLSSDYFFSQNNRDIQMTGICNAIADGFSELKNLSMHLDGCAFPELPNLLKKKSDKLEQLDLTLQETVSSSVINTVNSCNKLVSLNLNIRSPESAVCLANLTELQNLELVFNGKCSDETIADTFNQLHPSRKLQKLKLFVEDENHNIGLVNKIILKFPNLRKLCLKGVDGNQIDEELKQIHTLKNLEVLNISTCPGMSALSVKHISECLSLTSIMLLKCSLDESALEHFQNIHRAKNIVLDSCNLNSRKILLQTILKLEQLENIVIRGSQISSDDQKWILGQCEVYGRRKVNILYV